MPLLPHAHAASLFRRDATGRTVYFPVLEDKACYVVPDVESEQLIIRTPRRICFVQLAAWKSFPAVLIFVVTVGEGAGVLISKSQPKASQALANNVALRCVWPSRKLDADAGSEPSPVDFLQLGKIEGLDGYRSAVAEGTCMRVRARPARHAGMQ